MTKPIYRIPHHLLIQQLRGHAQRQAQVIGRYGWRPSKRDLQGLRKSLGDARAYRTLARAWRKAGFRVSAIRKFAGRTPADRTATLRHCAAAQTEMENATWH
jgi:hypothetical protein